MRFFDKMNSSNGEVCPICGTAKDGKVLLVPIPGTEDGNISEAKQIHADCAHLVASYYVLAKNNETN